MNKKTVSGHKRVRGERQLLVYETLRKEIVTLQLRPGEPLDETRLANRFEISRSPVREALIRLAGDGLALMLPNRSTLVAPFDLLLIPKYLDALSLLQRTTHHLAALQRSEKNLEAINKAHILFMEAVETNPSTAAIEANLEFHLSISEASRNPYFNVAYKRLLNEGVRMQHLHMEYIGWNAEEPGIQAHQEMIDAIENRDAKKAEQLAQAHAEQFDHKFMRFLSQKLSENIKINPM
ncbi:MAG: DNA-binding GntR family transcriptional regulator [Desulforhopalus sp.]|jgi:DNA-binding GntR family transcriptional regulator